MSTHQKLSSKDTPMTKLKRLWRDDFSEDDRDYWREQFESSRSQASLRQEIEEKHGITLRHDSQLKRFRTWVAEMDSLEAVEERAAEDLAELEQQGLTPGQLRDELLRRMQARALVHGDFNLGLKAIAAGVKVETLQLAREKFRAAYQTKVKAGLRCLGQEIRGNPAAAAAFDAFCAIVEPDDDATPKPAESPEPNRSAGHRPGSTVAATTIPSPTQSNPVKPTPEPVSPEPSRSVTPASPIGAPVSDPARPTCSANPVTAIGPISPMRPIPPNPNESNPVEPMTKSVGRVSSRGMSPTNPSIQPSINPNPAEPAFDPKEEYENSLFRMRINLEPYDQEKLLRLQAALPPEEEEEE